MRKEQYVRSAGSTSVPDGSIAAAAAGDPSRDAPPVGASPVDSVPSDQLWRAAILAARQAALTAAELRRALESGARREAL